MRLFVGGTTKYTTVNMREILARAAAERGRGELERILCIYFYGNSFDMAKQMLNSVYYIMFYIKYKP